MPTSQLQRVIRNLAQTSLQEAGAGLTDGQLLECYIRAREQEAFAALVHRHGAMVWGVCRRILAHQDAEDAFQATFFVLARKAADVVPRDMVANWLHGVAYQTALKARATAARRGAREKQVIAMPEREDRGRGAGVRSQGTGVRGQGSGGRHQEWDDVRPLLDLELGRLPDKYKAVIVLCDLEGKTRKEAARHFRVPEGTVASRLATARSMLARRLSRHGLVMSGAALALALAEQQASAHVPASVASTTIQAAILFAAGQTAAVGAISAQATLLAEGVLKTMLFAKLKLATAVLIVVAVLGMSVAAVAQPGADNPAQAPATQADVGQVSVPVQTGQEPNPVPPAAPAKKAEAPPTVVTGVVKAVDAGNRSLTVTRRDGEATYSLTDDAHISIDRKRGELANLPAGAHVVLSQFADEKVGNLCAEGAAVFGTVKAVDTDKNTITVARGHGEDLTYLVSPDTEITIDGQGGRTLATIPKGASLHALNLCVDQRTAHSINVEGPSLHHVEVKSVDAEQHTITFGDKAPRDAAGQTYAVAKDAIITIDGQPGKLSGIPSGAYVSIVLTVYGQTARRIAADGKPLGECGGSEVSAVNVAGSTITFGDKAPAEIAGKTFAVAKNANIVIDGRTETLAGLPVGARVNAILSVDQSTIRHLHVQGPSESGVVKAVDAEKNTIVIDDRTFAVAKDAGIVIDSRSGRLAALPTGAVVNVTLSVDQTAIRQLIAQGRDRFGAVKAVDTVKNTITVDKETFAVARDALVFLDANTITLGSLPEGAQVSLVMSVDQRTVRGIHARSP
jgi:RNA polymerase sigma factor (sigma-70 family)